MEFDMLHPNAARSIRITLADSAINNAMHFLRVCRQRIEVSPDDEFLMQYARESDELDAWKNM